MQNPAIPVAETQRLQALRSLSILDTFPEKRLDQFKRLAARVFVGSIALVSVVDRELLLTSPRMPLDGDYGP